MEHEKERAFIARLALIAAHIRQDNRGLLLKALTRSGLQHGLYKGHSCETLLIVTVYVVFKNYNIIKQVYIKLSPSPKHSICIAYQEYALLSENINRYVMPGKFSQ